MRLFMLVGLLTFSGFNLSAQDETLFDLGGETTGFGGPVVKYTSVNGQGAFMLGGRGGWIFNHSFVIGGGAYAVVSEVNATADIMPLEGPLDIEFACFGRELEYIVQTSSLLHYTIYTLIGGGATNFVKDVGPVGQSNQQAGETDFMFVVEPSVCAELNVTGWCRVAAGISYRVALGVDQVGLKDGDFTGPNASLTFKFGTF